MANKYAPFVKTLRTGRGFSQSFVAEKLGLSRQSYMAIERGSRELNLPEAEKLKDLYGISMEELTTASIPQYEKYKEMILAFLQVLIGNRDGKVPKTKLAKMLYLADFAWFYNNLESMSGTQYLKRTHGPVPNEYFRAIEELEETGKITIDHKNDALLVRIGKGAQRDKLLSLNKEEKTLIKDISKKWASKLTREIVDFTHNQLPYRICAADEVIPYELITQEDPENVY